MVVHGREVDSTASDLRCPVGHFAVADTVMAGYLFSVSRPDRYLWITLASSV